MSIRAFAAATALALAAAAVSQPPSAVAQPRPRPDDPAVKTPPTAPPSAFAGYRPFLDEPRAPWREVNEEVGRLGGHTGHMRDEAKPAVQQPSAGRADDPVRSSDAPGGRTHGH